MVAAVSKNHARTRFDFGVAKNRSCSANFGNNPGLRGHMSTRFATQSFPLDDPAGLRLLLLDGLTFMALVML